MEMTITRGLAELKLLNDRIEDRIEGASFVASNKKSSEKVSRIYTKEEFTQKAISDYQGVVDLIERRKRIKSAIVESNANTIVEIAGNSYFVSEAIERKESIEFDKMLLRSLSLGYRSALMTTNKENERVRDTLDKLLETMLGKESKNIAVESNEFAMSYLKDNEFEIIDPLKIVEKIERLQEDIENFEHEVNFILSESNSINKIIIED